MNPKSLLAAILVLVTVTTASAQQSSGFGRNPYSGGSSSLFGGGSGLGSAPSGSLGEGSGARTGLSGIGCQPGEVSLSTGCLSLDPAESASRGMGGSSPYGSIGNIR